MDDATVPAQFGIMQVDLMKRHNRGQNCELAQFDSIVLPGLILAQHIFRGLKRPLCADDSLNADEQVLIHSWKAAWDFEWNNEFGRPHRLQAPLNSVFVVLISKNMRHADKWPQVYGWINRWNWVDEDQKLPGAPISWDFRYEEKLFTREGG